LYASPNIRVIKSRRMKWAGHVVRIGKKRNAYRILVGKPEGKRRLVRHRIICEDNIRMNTRKTVWEGVYRIHLAQDMDQWRAVENFLTS